jgi:hypothetical protein
MNIAILFAATFVFVLSLGLQIQTSTAGNYVGAFCSSFFVGLTQIAALRIMQATTTWEYVAYLIGGPLGMVASMYIHRTSARRQLLRAEECALGGQMEARHGA